MIAFPRTQNMVWRELRKFEFNFYLTETMQSTNMDYIKAADMGLFDWQWEVMSHSFGNGKPPLKCRNFREMKKLMKRSECGEVR